MPKKAEKNIRFPTRLAATVRASIAKLRACFASAYDRDGKVILKQTLTDAEIVTVALLEFEAVIDGKAIRVDYSDLDTINKAVMGLAIAATMKMLQEKYDLDLPIIKDPSDIPAECMPALLKGARAEWQKHSSVVMQPMKHVN